ncbi:MAG: Uncharacterised protein [Flavobacteriia bacterium]|nr:MAG: Uncharacterised protein [Flavobacteriia bacterium]
MVFVAVRTDHGLHGETGIDVVLIRTDVDGLQAVEQGGSIVPVHLIRAFHHIVSMQSADGNEADVVHVQFRGEILVIAHDLGEGFLLIVDQIHLVDAYDQVRDLQKTCDVAVPSGLFDHTVPGIHQNERQVGCGCACDHVPGVLDVARRVGNDELSLWGREVAVGHIDRDPLFPLVPQSVGEQAQIHMLQTLSL